MKRVLTGLLLVMLAATLVVSCGQGSAAKGVEFVIGNGAEPQTIDPSKITGVPEHHIYMALFEGLVAYDAKTSLAIPGLAESWISEACVRSCGKVSDMVPDRCVDIERCHDRPCDQNRSVGRGKNEGRMENRCDLLRSGITGSAKVPVAKGWRSGGGVVMGVVP